MDRISPCQRPLGSNAGLQQWRDLLFLHWPVPLDVLRPLVPKALSIDTFEGTAYVGIVPFLMTGVRPWWLPKAMAFEFLECNLRTYVHLDGQGPGVYFFSLEAESWLAVQAARLGWGLPYFYAEMRMDKKPQSIEYELFRRGKKKPYFAAHYEVGEALPPSDPESLEFFLMERYLLYANKGKALMQGQVYHTPYPAHLAHPHHVREELIAAAGFPATDGPPALAHYSPGVDVEVFALQKVKDI